MEVRGALALTRIPGVKARPSLGHNPPQDQSRSEASISPLGMPPLGTTNLKDCMGEDQDQGSVVTGPGISPSLAFSYLLCKEGLQGAHLVEL